MSDSEVRWLLDVLNGLPSASARFNIMYDYYIFGEA